MNGLITSTQKSRRILLLWIDEDVLSDTNDPLQSLSALRRCFAHHKRQPNAPQ